MLRPKRAFKVKQKIFLMIFKELSIAKNCLSPDGLPLREFCSIKIR